MTQNKKTQKITVDYDTKWTHTYLPKNDGVYFTAKTPIEEVVPVLEQHLNSALKDLDVTYSKQSYNTFSRLYRGVISHHKGWRLYYKTPGSVEYRSLDQPIGYRSKNPKRCFKNDLKRRMRWTHELDPVVNHVEIHGVENFDTIAQRLNESVKQANFKPLFVNWSPHLEALVKSYQEMNKHPYIDFDFKNSTAWQTFSENLKRVNDKYQQLNVSQTNDYLVNGYNVSYIFQDIVKQAKGWSVQFLDKNS